MSATKTSTTQTGKQHTLPSPAELPDADVVIFDGECQFCQAQVARLRRLDSGNRLAFVSLHDPRAHEICPNLTHEQMMEQMFVVEPNGRQHGGAAALRYLSRRLPRLWPIAPFLHLPFCLPIWQWLYRQVASRRYRWNSTSCDSDACQVHFKK